MDEGTEESAIIMMDMFLSFFIGGMLSLFIILKWGNITYSPDNPHMVVNMSLGTGFISMYAAILARKSIQNQCEKSLNSKLGKIGVKDFTCLMITILAITFSALQGVMMTILLILLHYRYYSLLFAIFLILPYIVLSRMAIS